MLNTIYCPKAINEIPSDCRVLKYKYCGIECKVYENKDAIFLSKGTSVAVLDEDRKFVIDTKWLIPARNKYTNSDLVTTCNLEFDSRNRLATYIYGNAVQATEAFFQIEEKELDIMNFSYDDLKDCANLSPSCKRALAKELEHSAKRAETKTIMSPIINCVSEIKDGIFKIANNISEMNSKKSDIEYVYPYRGRIEKHEKGSSEYNNALANIDKVLNPDNIPCITKTLKRRGVYLAGEAGIGKGMIAQSIGAKLVEENEQYDSYANLVVNCSEITNLAQITWGTGMDNKEYIGAFPEAFMFASSNKNCAVVLVLDEILRCDWSAMLSPAFELLSSKRNKSHCIVGNGIRLTYEDNIYIVLTGNVGDKFKTGGAIGDSGFSDRFDYIKISGLFESKEFIEKYMNSAIKLDTKLSENDIREFLYDIFDLVKSNPKVSKTISLRKLSDFIEESDTKEDFILKVKSLFSEGDRERLGWDN